MRSVVKMRLTRIAGSFTNHLDVKSLRLLDSYSRFNPSSLSIKQIMDFGIIASEVDSYLFLKREALVRMANTMKEINLLPSTLLQMPSIVTLQRWYAKSFVDFCSFEGRDSDEDTLRDFCDTLKAIMKRHEDSIETMAEGVMELKDAHAVDISTETSIQYFLDRFCMSRISVRMLANQHITLFEGEQLSDSKMVGIVDPSCSVQKVVAESVDKAASLCAAYYNCCPDVNIQIKNYWNSGEPISIPYPTTHLRHILFELLKNSMRAVMENRAKDLAFPDIEILIIKGAHDISIKISDQGGGIPRDVTDKLFLYHYSTAPAPSVTSRKAPMAGYGYGLPLSRLYARYLHGDLILTSAEGHGTDAVVYLKVDGHEASELLPIFNRTSSKQYRTPVPVADWTDPFSAMNSAYHPQYSIPSTKGREKRTN